MGACHSFQSTPLLPTGKSRLQAEQKAEPGLIHLQLQEQKLRNGTLQ